MYCYTLHLCRDVKITRDLKHATRENVWFLNRVYFTGFNATMLMSQQCYVSQIIIFDIPCMQITESCWLINKSDVILASKRV